MVGIAQLAEHYTVDVVVEGSRPFAHPHEKRPSAVEGLFRAVCMKSHLAGWNTLLRVRVRAEIEG